MSWWWMLTGTLSWLEKRDGTQVLSCQSGGGRGEPVGRLQHLRHVRQVTRLGVINRGREAKRWPTCVRIIKNNTKPLFKIHKLTRK